MKLQACQNLFPTPVLSFSVPEAETLNAQFEQEIRAIRDAEDGVTRTNRNGWHSDGGLFQRDEPGIAALCAHIRDSFVAATRLIAPGFDIDAHDARLQGWINVSPQGAYNTPHSHPRHQWSGCYYVTQPEVEEGQSGMIEFLDPRGSLSDATLLRAQAFSHSFRIRPEQGTMLVFPSFLQHWVHPNQQPQERITVAWNGRFKPRKKNP